MSLMIQHLVHNNICKPIKIFCEGPNFSHLLFANGCILFTKDKGSPVKLVRDVLQFFLYVS